MAFEPFKAASTSAKVVNVLIILFLFLSWVSTMVTFGSVLHTLSAFGITADFYWNHVHVNSPAGSYNYAYDDPTFASEEGGTSLSNCKSGGDATLAFAIFAFLAFLIHIPTAFCRIAGLNFPLARDTQHSLYIELVLTAIEWFCFFLQLCIWGGTCYSPSSSISGASITGKGFGFAIACFFFLTYNLIVYFLMRSNDNLVLGNGASRGGDSGGYGGGGYEGGGAEYSHDSTQPAFSYQANPSDSQTM